MHPLHDYIAKQIASRIQDRKVVILYDPREELDTFFGEVVTGERGANVQSAAFGLVKANLARFNGSYLQLRYTIEEATCGDLVDNLVVYIPGVARNENTSLLLEIEKAGTFFQQQPIRSMVRNVLRSRFTDVQIDEKLRSEVLQYNDYLRITTLNGNEDDASLLKAIFKDSDTQALLAAWISGDRQDQPIIAKAAVHELQEVVQAKLGIRLRLPRRPMDQDCILATPVQAEESFGSSLFLVLGRGYLNGVITWILPLLNMVYSLIGIFLYVSAGILFVPSSLPFQVQYYLVFQSYAPRCRMDARVFLTPPIENTFWISPI